MKFCEQNLNCNRDLENKYAADGKLSFTFGFSRFRCWS